jgi:hypothetical protein
VKRDWDLIRKLLIEIDEYPHFDINAPITAEIIESNIVQPSREQIDYHLMLLCDAGLLLAPKSDHAPAYTGGITRWRPEKILGLSWAGHEFLETIHNETVWERTKKQLQEKGSALTFELIQQTALFFLKQHLGLL